VPDEELTRCVWVDTWFPRGGAGNSLKAAEAGKSTYLRVVRKEKVVTVSYSFDGSEWSTPFTPRQALDFPDEVTVGAFFAHSTYQVVEATFDGLTVEKPKEKKE
jgi:regulation of enolase protein 1 (concanavalin A-like superfamily)